MAKTVVLKGDPVRKEGVAAEAVTPGHLIEFVPSGADAGKLRKHASAGQNAAHMFAVEEEFVGDDIDTAYAASDTVQYVAARPGDEVNALVAAAAAAIVKGNFLESAGNGTVRKHTVPSQAVNEGGTNSYTITQYTRAVVGQALEAVDNSGGGTAGRIKGEVL